MAEQEAAFHYVCTHEAARKIAESNDEYWVSDCGCRAERNSCKRSRIDLCLHFNDHYASSEPTLKQVTRDDVESLFTEASSSQLVTRPFRNETDRTVTDGICFCCDDCCDYFKSDEAVCDKGDMVELTDPDECTHCGLCEDICYFKARIMENGLLALKNDNCYGCGLCVPSCPVNCIEMVSRERS